jgi:membrane protein YqaA with SNARE-associated domain
MDWDGLIAIFVQTHPARRRPAQTGFNAAIRHLGAFGLFLLAILDSSPIPTFGSLDLLTAILAARHREPWYFYAIISTAGSLIGAVITFRIAKRAGSAYLTKKFGEQRVSHLLRYVQEWGEGTLIVGTLLPPPFPTTAVFAAAGIVDFPLKRYLTGVAVGRGIRYSILAAVAAHYGRHFIRLIRHPQRYLGWSLLVAFALIALLVGGTLAWERIHVAHRDSGSPAQQPGTQQSS